MRRVPAVAHTFFRGALRRQSTLAASPNRSCTPAASAALACGMRTTLVAFASILGLATATLPAFVPRLDPQSIQQAIVIGHSSLAGERQRFHQPYRVVASKPPVDFVDVVTPFRRVVMAAESRARQGDHRFGQRDALELLAADGAHVTIRAEFTFHPLNTFVIVPDYRMLLIGRAQTPVTPSGSDRIARFGPRTSDDLPAPTPGGLATLTPGRSQPMLGATLLATFDHERIDPRGTYELVVTEAGRELARAAVDFARLR